MRGESKTREKKYGSERFRHTPKTLAPVFLENDVSFNDFVYKFIIFETKKI